MNKLYRIIASRAPISSLKQSLPPCWALLAEGQYKSHTFKSTLFSHIRYSNVVIVGSNAVMVMGFALLNHHETNELIGQIDEMDLRLTIDRVDPMTLKNYCSEIPDLSSWFIRYDNFDPFSRFLTNQYMEHVFTCHKINAPEAYSYR